MAVTAAANGRFRHLALFYHGRSKHLAALCAFIQAGRARGDAVLPPPDLGLTSNTGRIGGSAGRQP